MPWADSVNRFVMFWALTLTLSGGGLEFPRHSGAPSSLREARDDHVEGVSPADSRCGAVATFADGKTPSQIRHVSITGSDTSGNGSATRPFRTIRKAAQSISPGTAIYVHAGIHGGGTFLTGVHGTEAQPVWIMGAPGEARPVIQGGGEALHLTNPRYVVLQNLEILGTADNGINVDDGGQVANPEAARFVVFRDLDIHDTGKRPSGVADCLKLAGLNDFFVLGSRFARCGSGAASGAVGVGGVGVHRGRVSFNRFLSNGYGGLQVKGGSYDIEITSNAFQDTGWRSVNMGGSTGPALFRPPLSPSALNYEAARIRVLANIFEGSEAAASFTGCLDCEFSHNTVVNPSKWVLRILQETVTIASYTFARAANGRIADNIFYFRRSDLGTGEDINVGTNTDTRSFSLTRNLWYAHDAPAQSSPRISTFLGAHAGSLVGTRPDFVNASASDFHLKAGSPANGAGSVLFAPGSDFAGECYANPPSLGALELTGKVAADFFTGSRKGHRARRAS
jgi:hypothetical protein